MCVFCLFVLFVFCVGVFVCVCLCAYVGCGPGGKRLFHGGSVLLGVVHKKGVWPLCFLVRGGGSLRVTPTAALLSTI